MTVYNDRIEFFSSFRQMISNYFTPFNIKIPSHHIETLKVVKNQILVINIKLVYKNLKWPNLI